jgi:hypothetical protein
MNADEKQSYNEAVAAFMSSVAEQHNVFLSELIVFRKKRLALAYATLVLYITLFFVFQELSNYFFDQGIRFPSQLFAMFWMFSSMLAWSKIGDIKNHYRRIKEFKHDKSRIESHKTTN